MWDKITVKDLQKIVKASTLDMDYMDKQIMLMSMITGRPEDELWDMPKDQFLNLCKKYNYKDLPEGNPPKEFEAGGYTWIPETNVAKFSSGQYIDLVEYCKDSINYLPQLLATICTPIKRYPLFIKVTPALTFEQKVTALEQAKAKDVYPLSLFFCRVLIHFTNAMQDSLAKETKEMMNRAMAGDGTTS
jgi:hypothetical protein